MDTLWRIQLLGALRAQYGRHVLTGLTGQKAGALLAYLAYYCHTAHPRELIIDLLWPHLDLDAGRNNLRVLLHALRRQLAAAGDDADRLLVADRTAVGLRSDAFTSDHQELLAALRAAERATSPAERTAHLTHVALHSGELLPESCETWVLSEREHLRAIRVQALHRLVGLLEAAGDREQAIAYAHQAVRLDPLREESHCDLMRLYAASGQPGAAERQYQQLTRILDEELGETPSAATRALAEELRSDARVLIVARGDLASTEDRRPGESAGKPGSGEKAQSTPAPGPPLHGALASLRSCPQSPPLIAGNLPVQFTRFFGREAEIAALCAWFGLTTEARRHGEDERVDSVSFSPCPPCLRGETSPPRLVTVTGPGGSGKTRLAIAGAGRLKEFFGDAIAFVPLADLTDASRIPDAVADALALTRSPEAEVLDQVVEELRARGQRAPRGPLLVLDNFEHLLAGPPAAGPGGRADGSLLVRRLLERVPALCLLVTSRQRLGLGGEQELALLPLPTPRRGASWTQLQECAAVQLFVDRARSARPDFQLTEANAVAVGELCDRLDGLPLALELAAARIGVLSPREMLGQLERRFAFLVTRHRDTPDRHRTLRAVIESSYQLLDGELQRFFARLSVFRGGWTLEAAQAVCDAPQALDCMEQLRDCSLLTVEEEGRYRLLETLREYAWEQLAASGEQAEIQRRHWEWYLHLAERGGAAADLPEQREWLLRLERDLDNFRAALRACHEAAGGVRTRTPGSAANRHGDRAAAEAGLRLATALAWFWIGRGYLTEGVEALETALADGADLPAAVRAPALGAAANVVASRGDGARAAALRRQSRRAHEAVLLVARRDGDRQEIAATLRSLVETCFWLGDPDATWIYGLEARQLMDELGDPVGLPRTLKAMASVALTRGDRATGRALLEERLAICRRLGTATLLVHALGGMGHLERDEGNYERARAFYQESMLLRRELGDKFALAQSLEDLAVLAWKQGQVERAIRLLGAGEGFCETLGARSPVSVAVEYERTIAGARAALGEAAFAAAWAEGRAMSLEAVIRYALEEPPDPAPPA